MCYKFKFAYFSIGDNRLVITLLVINSFGITLIIVSTLVGFPEQFSIN